MGLSLRELFVVALIAAAVFRAARPIALKFIAQQDLSRRRNTWFALTATAFIAPNFWVFALVAVLLIPGVARRDSNPCALYLMLFAVIPPVDVPVPMIGMESLFSINMFLLLSFCVLVPLASKLYRLKGEQPENALQFADYCLLAFGLLCSIFYIRAPSFSGALYPVTITEIMRRCFVFFFDTFILYYVVSRVSADRRKMLDMLATYCLSCAVLAAIAVFETLRGWLVYGGLETQWGLATSGAFYLVRAGGLRAMASTGHAMALAHLLVLAFGVWLYLQSRFDSKVWRAGGVILFWSGLFAAFTRGALFGAVLTYFLFAALRPKFFSRIITATGAAMIAGVLVYISPLGDKIVNAIPGFGAKVDDSSLIYRERLWDRTWQIIEQSPFLGDQEAMLKMQDLRQGEGIVDVVNTYAGILLSNGFIGLSLFMVFSLTALLKTWVGNRRTKASDQDLCLLGAGLFACFLATLVILWDSSFIRAPARMFYVFAGFAAGYSVLVRSPRLSESAANDAMDVVTPAGHAGPREVTGS
jgi:O-antigen ligase